MKEPWTSTEGLHIICTLLRNESESAVERLPRRALKHCLLFFYCLRFGRRLGLRANNGETTDEATSKAK